MSAPMSEHLRAALDAALRHREPATDEDVRRAASDALSVGGHSHTPLIHERLMRAEVRVPAIVRRLLDAEAEAERLRKAAAMACANCCGPVGWIECPTGGWWAHDTHPKDGHDAAPIPAAALDGAE